MAALGWTDTEFLSKARYTLFANNSEIGVKRQNTYVWQIVYKRCSPCFVNRFFAVTMYGESSIKGGRHVSQTGFLPYPVCRICVGVAILSTNTKYFFVEKKIFYRAKIDGEQRNAYSNTFVSFSPTIFYSVKK